MAAPAVNAASAGAGRILMSVRPEWRSNVRARAAKSTRATTNVKAPTAAAPRHPARNCRSTCERSSSEQADCARASRRALSCWDSSDFGQGVATAPPAPAASDASDTALRAVAGAVPTPAASSTRRRRATPPIEPAAPKRGASPRSLEPAVVSEAESASVSLSTARRLTGLASRDTSLSISSVESRSRAILRSCAPRGEPSTVRSESKGVAACAACAAAPAEAATRSTDFELAAASSDIRRARSDMTAPPGQAAAASAASFCACAACTAASCSRIVSMRSHWNWLSSVSKEERSALAPEAVEGDRARSTAHGSATS
eukprot:scaffold13277_cov114-Isochrysis_galbana.AAC.1